MVMDSLWRVFWLSTTFNFRLRAFYYPGPANFLADAVSRLHEHGGVSRLQTLLSGTRPSSNSLVIYIIVIVLQGCHRLSCRFLCLNRWLYKNKTYVPNTGRTYKSQLVTYQAFCRSVGQAPVPVTSETLCMYAALLAWSLATALVRQYLNVVRILHLDVDLPTPWITTFNLLVCRGAFEGTLRTNHNAK